MSPIYVSSFVLDMNLFQMITAKVLIMFDFLDPYFPIGLKNGKMNQKTDNFSKKFRVNIY